jgi:predicted ArsR family transcriptional regulator
MPGRSTGAHRDDYAAVVIAGAPRCTALEDVALALDVSPSTARRHLDRAVEAGTLEARRSSGPWRERVYYRAGDAPEGDPLPKTYGRRLRAEQRP